MDDATLAALRTAGAAVSDIGLATLVGALATTTLLRGARSAWADRGARRARTAFAAATATALVAGLAVLWVQAMSMTDSSPWNAIAAAPDIVTGTQFGRAWGGGMAALLACAVIAVRWRVVRPDALGGVVAAIAVVVLAFARASAGHAGASGFDVQTAAMVVHLLAIGAWSGAAIVGAILVGATPQDGDDRADGERYLARLSRLATTALALVVLTGGVAAWHEAGGRLGALWPSAAASAWTWTLAVKLVLVGVAVALGGFNRFATLPALAGSLVSNASAVDTPWRRFARILRVEAVVLLAVLVAAAVLANGEPPAV